MTDLSDGIPPLYLAALKAQAERGQVVGPRRALALIAEIERLREALSNLLGRYISASEALGWSTATIEGEDVVTVARAALAEPTDADLHRFGWAPGGYMIKCDDCDGDGGFVDGADKRAWRCRPCAVKLWLTDKTNQ